MAGCDGGYSVLAATLALMVAVAPAQAGASALMLHPTNRGPGLRRGDGSFAGADAVLDVAGVVG